MAVQKKANIVQTSFRGSDRITNYSNCNSEMSDIQVAECVYNPGDTAMLSWSRVTRNSMETSSKHDKTTIKDTSGYNVCYLTGDMLTCE